MPAPTREHARRPPPAHAVRIRTQLGQHRRLRLAVAPGHVFPVVCGSPPVQSSAHQPDAGVSAGVGVSVLHLPQAGRMAGASGQDVGIGVVEGVLLFHQMMGVVVVEEWRRAGRGHVDAGALHPPQIAHVVGVDACRTAGCGHVDAGALHPHEIAHMVGVDVWYAGSCHVGARALRPHSQTVVAVDMDAWNVGYGHAGASVPRLRQAGGSAGVAVSDFGCGVGALHPHPTDGAAVAVRG